VGERRVGDPDLLDDPMAGLEHGGRGAVVGRVPVVQADVERGARAQRLVRCGYGSAGSHTVQREERVRAEREYDSSRDLPASTGRIHVESRRDTNRGRLTPRGKGSDRR
jgi:hypothetical protein